MEQAHQVDLWGRCQVKREDVYAYLRTEGFEDDDIRPFFRLHDRNPKVWEEFERRAKHKIMDGSSRVGSKQIFEEMRAEQIFQTDEERALNNNYTSMIARVFVFIYPRYRDFIELRPLLKRVNLKRDRAKKK